MTGSRTAGALAAIVGTIAASGCMSGGDAGGGGATREQAFTQCATNAPEGIDVYSGDGTVDWGKVKTSGRTFAFIKASQGSYDTQSTFNADWSGAKAAGVLRSPYHFFDGTSDGSGQARVFLNELAGAGGLEDGDLPPLLDLECPTDADESQTSPSCEYPGTDPDSGWVDNATLKQRVYDWLDTVQAATGRTPIIYSYVSWFAGVNFTDKKLADYPLFIASYATCATIPAPWTAATFWQYSSTAQVPGVSASDVDVDRFFGSAGDLLGLTVAAQAPDAGVGPSGPDAGSGGDTGPDAGTGHGNPNDPALVGACAAGGRGGSTTFAGVVVAMLAISWRRRQRR